MKYFYTINRLSSSYRGIEHIYLRLYDAAQDQVMWTRDQLFNFKWQGSEEFDHWYGFHLELEADGARCAAERLQQTQLLLRRLAKANVNIENPGALLAALEQFQIERRVHDDRTGAYLSLKEIKGPEYGRWMSWVEGSCSCSVLATNEDEARTELLKEHARQVADDRHSYRSSQLEKWLAAGKPIREDTHRNLPDIRPLAEILKPMKQPVPEAIAA